MDAYYIMTNWGPMKVSRGASTSSKDASVLISEIEELKSLINVLLSQLVGDGGTLEIDTLLEVSQFLTNYNNTETLKETSIEADDTTIDEYTDVFNN